MTWKMKENLQSVLNNSQNAYQMGQNARKTTDIYREEIVYREWMDYLMSVIGKTDNPVKISNSKRLINDLKTKNGEKYVESQDSVIFTDP